MTKPPPKVKLIINNEQDAYSAFWILLLLDFPNMKLGSPNYKGIYQSSAYDSTLTFRLVKSKRKVLATMCRYLPRGVQKFRALVSIKEWRYLKKYWV